MATTLVSTGIQFPDATIQTVAATVPTNISSLTNTSNFMNTVTGTVSGGGSGGSPSFSVSLAGSGGTMSMSGSVNCNCNCNC
jgi:hypothetical protein